jgi:hypothetical protein
MDDTASALPPYEAMSFYAFGIDRNQRSLVRKSAFEMQQLCRNLGVRSYMADNMIAIGRNIGFTRDPAFLEAFGGACQQPDEQCAECDAAHASVAGGPVR